MFLSRRLCLSGISHVFTAVGCDRVFLENFYLGPGPWPPVKGARPESQPEVKVVVSLKVG